MKTTFTKFFVVALLHTSQIVIAQAPLSPLFENNTMKWGASSYSKGGICDQYNDVISLYQIEGDTVLNLESFKILTCSFSSNVPSCIGSTVSRYYSTSKKYLKQSGNLILETDISGQKSDTILYIESITVGSKVKYFTQVYGRQSTLITSIDSIFMGDKKVRRITFGYFAFIDGVGFDDNGPFSSGVPSWAQEISSSLNCFSKNGISYSIERNTQRSSIMSAMKISNTSCERPLAIDAENVEEADLLKVFVNQNNLLETSQIASSIEIVDSKGQKVIQNKDASTTDVSVLQNGIYIANITFANKVLKHKFLVNN
jgi:hypothetical protein